MLKVFTVLVCDNLPVGPIAHLVNQPGYHFALIREAQSKPEVSDSDTTQPDPSDTVLALIDRFNPDLILVGNNLGVGKKKVLFFPKNKKRVTTILSNDLLGEEDARWYKERGFTSFCLRENLAECLPQLIKAALDAKMKNPLEHPKGVPIPDPKVVHTNGS